MDTDGLTKVSVALPGHWAGPALKPERRLPAGWRSGILPLRLVR
jgi:hypothetical protein